MMLKGKVGATTFYVAESRQLARQAMNNSNYGVNASRTDLQQARRVKWSNLVNFYSANKAWMKKAYEDLKPGVSIFNRFIQLNINSAQVALTKSEAQAKLWVPASYRVTQGSLQPLTAEYVEEMPSLALSSVDNIGDDTTVAAFSESILSGNSRFAEGDAIVCVSFWGVTGTPGGTTGMIPARYLYSEFVIDTQDTATMASKYPNWFTEGTALKDSNGDGSQAFVFIHTRKSGGKLYVSTQDMVLNPNTNTNVEAWRDGAQLAKAIASYGESTTVPLAPGGNVSGGSGNDNSTGGGSGDGSGSLG